MKTLIYFSFTAILMVAVYAFVNPKVDFTKDTEGGIQFYKGTFEEALATAKKENKIVFLDIYIPFCGTCKKLKTTTFSDPKVGEFYNQKFINLAFDGEQEDGARLMEKYSLRGYPSLVFLDKNGKVIKKTSGYYSANDFLELGKNVKIKF